MLTLWDVTRAVFGTASKLLELQLRGEGDAGDDASRVPEDDAAFVAQLGIAVRPVIARTLKALGYQDGDEIRVLKLWDKAKSPTDLAVGETRVFACGEVLVSVRCLAANRIEVSANGGQVVFNGGNVPVAKEGSATTGHTHAAGALVAGPYVVSGATASATDTVATGAGSQNIRVP